MTDGSPSQRKRWIVMVGVAAGLCVAGRARADSFCFPPGGGGVPGQPGLPDWWTGGAPFDDPRWLGSFGAGKGPSKLSAIVETTGGQKFLLLKWNVTPDPGTAGPGDQLLVGFYNPATVPKVATVIKLTRDALVSTTAGTVGVNVMSAAGFTRNDAAGLWSSVAVPSDISVKARLDTTCGLVDPIDCPEWTIRLRVPTTVAGGGIALGDTFDMWYELTALHDGGTFDRDKWPPSAATADLTADPIVLPAETTWNEVKTDSACTNGIDIDHGDITVTNASGAGTEINVDTQNTFHVKPINDTFNASNMPIGFAANAIKAQLRIADWGSAVGDSPRWITVPDPSCAAATGTGGIVNPPGRFDLTCTWTLTPGQKCAYRPDLAPAGCTPDPGPRYHHQCIMAELSSNGPPVNFLHESSWNNFQFGPASKLEEKARIDIGALGPRDVYLYVTTQNMPAVVPPLAGGQGGASGQGQGQGQGDGKGNPAPPPIGLSASLRDRLGGVLGGAIVPGRVTAKQAAELSALVAAGRISYDDVAKVMPTYGVYVWHDTGTTDKTTDGVRKLLESQPSFGLFISHDGALTGWKHALSALGGVTVTTISRDFYKLSVGSSGTVEILNSVEALEPPPPPPSQTWAVILLVLLILVVLLILWWLFKKPPPAPVAP